MIWIESPREAFQGLQAFIPTREKTRYLEALLRVGFDVVEAGSIASPRAIPQMKDSLEVLDLLGPVDSATKLMMLLVSKRGTEVLAQYPQVRLISYPFSISPSFSLLNQRASLEDSEKNVDHIQDFCLRTGREMVLYISMAYGNPYGDAWNSDLLFGWIERMAAKGIRTIALSNVSIEVSESTLSEIFGQLIQQFPMVDFGLHLHTPLHSWEKKVEAALGAGCRRFDTVMSGLGGCPMSGKELMGNLETLGFYDHMHQLGYAHRIDRQNLMVAKEILAQILIESGNV